MGIDSTAMGNGELAWGEVEDSRAEEGLGAGRGGQ